MEEIHVASNNWQLFVQMLHDLGLLLAALVLFLLRWWVVITWLACSLWAINWKKVWPVLAAGGWAPLALLLVISALAWSQLAPADADFLGVLLPNFWWQLGAVCVVAALTFLCGWLQGQFGWAPPEISLEPPEAGHDHAAAHH